MNVLNFKNNKFPKKFFFGVATSAEQTEGLGNCNKAKTNWDLLYEKNPNLFFNQIGPSVTNDILNHYKDDLKLLKKLKINSYRTSFSWARIFIEENKINQEAINFYHNYIDEMIKNDLKVFMCLSHFDLPDWFIKKGGFEKNDNAKYFLEFAKLILKEFGHKIDYLSTFNEPIVPIYFGYLGQSHYPQIVDSTKAIQVAYVVILAHSLVIDFFNKNYREKIKTKIGVITNIAPALPKDNVNYSNEDKLAADNYNLLHNYALLDAMVNGFFSNELISLLKKENILPKYLYSEIDIIKRNKLDFIGINYYSPFRVETNNNVNHNIFEKIAKPYKWEKAIMNKSRGWEILPEMIYFISEIIKNRYNNIPFYISENGIGIENENLYFNKEKNIIEDDYRIAFINEHLSVLLDCIKNKNINCFGYHLWTGIDCWSWMNAYKNRYGLISLDLKSQTRSFKKSAFYFRDVIKKRKVKNNLKRVDTYFK